MRKKTYIAKPQRPGDVKVITKKIGEVIDGDIEIHWVLPKQ